MFNYQVGNLIHRRDDDPKVQTEGEAIRTAEKMADQGFEQIPVGVWDSEDELQAIFYQGQWFSSENR